MAKVTLLTEDRKTEEALIYLNGLMKVRKITQEQMANELDISRMTLLSRMQHGTLTYKDLLLMFDKLDVPQEKRSELLTL